MKRLALGALAFLALTGADIIALPPITFDENTFTRESGRIIGGAVIVPDNASLLTKSTTAYPRGVWRADYAVGLGAGPLFYQASGSACSLNSGAGDNGSQVPSSNGTCWLGVFPNGVYNVLQFGADPTNATDSFVAIQNAVTAANGKTTYFPKGQYKACTEIISSVPVHYRGDGTGAGPGVWTTTNASVLSTCSTTQNGTVVTNNEGSTFERMWFRLLAGLGPATAGDMIKLTYTTTGHVEMPVFREIALGNSSFTGTKTIWNGIHIIRPEYPMIENIHCQGWVNHCIHFETTAGVESSGGFIAHNHFFGDGSSTAQAAPIYSEVGYTDVHDNEILGGAIGVYFAINNNPAGWIKIHDNTIENSTNYGIRVVTQDGSAASHLMIQNNEFSNVSFTTNLTSSISVDEYPGGGTSTAWIADIQITGNVLRNSSKAAGKYIWLQTGKNVNISGNQIEELGVAANVVGINVAGSTAHTGLAVPILVADNQMLGTITKYAINATQLVTLRDPFGMTLANTPTGAANGSQVYISNADPATGPCTAVGAQTGSIASRMNGAWKCF